MRLNGLEAIDEIVAAAVADGQVPGVVATVACGDDVHTVAAGEATVGAAPMREDTLFRIASITKPMTAAVALSLVGDGTLALDEPIDRLLPELADRRVLCRPDGPLDDTEPAARAATVRELLTFTWGFGMQGAMFVAPQPWPIVAAAAERSLSTFGPPAPGSTPDPDTWLSRLAELPLLLQPGSKWLYSSGSQLLGVLIARATGKPWEQAMQERLLDPLGMSDTSFWAADSARLATAYASAAGEFVVVDPPDGQWSRPPAFPDGAAGLVSTAADVVRFGRMLLRGGAGVLRAETVAEMTRDQLTTEQRSYDWGGFDMLSGRGWGYGVSVLDDGSYSWDGGSGTTWSNVPDLDLTVVVLTQRQWDETGPPAVCDAVRQAARAAVVSRA
ncbi:MAG TPA: serine hydrolase domain-containing protein [Jatrophihabitans sp.]|nr:serine hydrolase domain-containing protein [Jatrophihabitans sp.]